MIITLLLILIFMFIGIGAILWVEYSFNKDMEEIDKDHYERLKEILETGLKDLEKIHKGEEWTTPYLFSHKKHFVYEIKTSVYYLIGG